MFFRNGSGIFRLPAMLLGAVLTGWVTLAVYGAWAAAQIYLGTRLLSLQQGARVGSIGFFCFAAVYGVVSLVRPGYAEMVRQTQIAMPSMFLANTTIAMPGPMWVFAVSTMGFCAVPIFFLVRRRPAFH